MRYYKIIKHCLFSLSLVLLGTSFAACEDNIKLDANGNYDNVEGVYGAVKNVTGARDLSTITVFGSSTAGGQLYFELTEAATEAVSMQLKVDEKALETYNAAHGTSFKMYPQAQVTLANNGVVNIAAGTKKSEVVDVTVSSNGENGTTYALPISAEIVSGGVSVSKANQSYIYLVQPYPAIPSSDKGTGIKAICYIEVNDENLLNVGEYTMAGSGKPFFDVVNIFAANINYNSETKRAYVNNNDNVSFILKNADKFIRPLQAKGIKVCLTILGNHDEAGIANLSPEAAADFARELKAYVDVYGLDGIDFDDEYSSYNKLEDINDYVPSNGFVFPVGGKGTANLIYACRKIMPDKIISIYDFEDYYPTGTVKDPITDVEVGIGKLIDHSYWGAYANWRDRHGSITGMDKKQYGPSSFNLNFSAGNGGYDLGDSQKARAQGYGIQMFYNLKANYDYYEMFNKIGNVLFDDNVKWTGVTYAKNSTSGRTLKGSYESYIGEWETTSDRSLFHDGQWWQWGGSVKTKLTIEKDVEGKSYKLYGWYGTEDELPLVLNYDAEHGRLTMPLPQKAIDTKTNEEWLYLGRYQYPYNSAYFLNFEEQYTGYIGVINNNRIVFQAAPVSSGFKQTRTLSAVQLDASGTKVVAVKGSLVKDIVWQPYTMTK